MSIFNEIEEREALESIVDRLTLATVLNMLATVCHEKADHVRTNWQDGTSSADKEAKGWDNAAQRIHAVSQTFYYL